MCHPCLPAGLFAATLNFALVQPDLLPSQTGCFLSFLLPSYLTAHHWDNRTSCQVPAIYQAEGSVTPGKPGAWSWTGCSSRQVTVQKYFRSQKTSLLHLHRGAGATASAWLPPLFYDPTQKDEKWKLLLRRPCFHTVNNILNPLNPDTVAFGGAVHHGLSPATSFPIDQMRDWLSLT